nr:MAG TPA: hypothetical protein [Caudoviricetes sp.]
MQKSVQIGSIWICTGATGAKRVQLGQKQGQNSKNRVKFGSKVGSFGSMY